MNKFWVGWSLAVAVERLTHGEPYWAALNFAAFLLFVWMNFEDRRNAL